MFTARSSRTGRKKLKGDDNFTWKTLSK